MSPKLRSLLARVTLFGGVALVAAYSARSAPHDQSIAVRLSGRDVLRVSGVVTKVGDDEATAGFSRDFSPGSPAPHLVRHAFSAQNGTYIVLISCTERVAPMGLPPSGEQPNGEGPKLIETSFERRVSLAGGEVIVSPD